MINATWHSCWREEPTHIRQFTPQPKRKCKCELSQCSRVSDNRYIVSRVTAVNAKRARKKPGRWFVGFRVPREVTGANRVGAWRGSARVAHART